MTGQVAVVGYRHLIEPPVRGDCQDPDCQTVHIDVPVEIDLLRSGADPSLAYGSPGRGLLLVAFYGKDRRGPHGQTIRVGYEVCAPCDNRRLRAWLEDES